MTVALIATRIPTVDELEFGVLTDAWVQDRFGPDEVVLFADMASEGLDRLLHAGYRVEIHPKRRTVVDGGHARSGDEVRATLVASLDPERIIYASDAAADLSWYEPALADVPATVLISGRATAALPVVMDDPDLWAHHGVGSWLAASALCSLPLEADEDAGALGIRAHASPVERRDTVAPSSGALVVVTMLAPQRAEIAAHWERFLETVPVDESMSVVVVVRPRRDDADDVRALLGAVFDARTPPPLVVLAEDAAPFLARADSLVVFSEADLLVPAIAGAADRVGVTVLSPVHRLAAFASHPVRAGTCRVLSGADGTTLAAQIRALADSDAEVVVIDRDAGDDAARLAAYGALAAADITLLGMVDGGLGSPQIDHVADDVAAVHRRLWPSVLRWLDEGATPHRVVRALAAPGMGSHGTVRLMPSSRELPHAPAVPIWRLPVPVTDGPFPPPGRATVPEERPRLRRPKSVVARARRAPLTRALAKWVPATVKTRLRQAVRTVRRLR